MQNLGLNLPASYSVHTRGSRRLICSLALRSSLRTLFNWCCKFWRSSFSFSKSVVRIWIWQPPKVKIKELKWELLRNYEGEREGGRERERCFASIFEESFTLLSYLTIGLKTTTNNNNHHLSLSLQWNSYMPNYEIFQNSSPLLKVEFKIILVGECFKLSCNLQLSIL